MNNNISVPGFTATFVLEPMVQRNHYLGTQRIPSDQHGVLLQRGNEFACGLAWAAAIGGIALGNPFAVIGGLGGIATQC